MSTPPKPSRPAAPADAHASAVADALERARTELRESALADVMADGSSKALAASEIVDALIHALRADDEAELMELRKVATLQGLRRANEKRRQRSHEVWDLFEVFFTTADGPQVQALVEQREFEKAGDLLAERLEDALVGLADFFERMRGELPDMHALQALRPRVAAVVCDALGEDDRNFDWQLNTFRGVLRAWGVPWKDAEQMTDFIRKR